MPQFALIFTTVIWAATFPATKLALQAVPPMSFLFLRFVVSTLAVGIVIFMLRRRIHGDRKSLRMAALASFFLVVGYVTQTVGLQYTTASNSAFITALYAVFVPLFLGRFTTVLWVALGLALTGLWLMVRPSTAVSVGDILTLICAVAFAFHIIALEFFAAKTDAESLTTWQLIMVTLALVAPTVWEGFPFNAAIFSPALVGALIITGVLATGLAFFIQVWAQRRVPAQRVALIFALEPALSAWMSWLVLGEKLDEVGWVGSALILAGVVVGTRATDAPHAPLQP